jgi:osmotically-inducible protein OsmY
MMKMTANATATKGAICTTPVPKRFSAMSVLALALVATQLTGCVAAAVGTGVVVGAMVASDRRTSGAQLDDEGIELRSANRLATALKSQGHINVTSFNRRVLLTGEVPTERDRQIAEQTVSGVDNVKFILNELAVMPNSTLGQRTEDTVITGRVKAALLDSSLSSNAFKVVTERGVVYLMGRVSNTESDIATKAARAVPGVLKVVRSLEILSLDEQQRMNVAQ